MPLSAADVRNCSNVIEPEKSEAGNWRNVEIAGIDGTIVFLPPHVAAGTADLPQLATGKFDDVVFYTPPSIVNLHSDPPLIPEISGQEAADQMANVWEKFNFQNFESNRLLELQSFHDTPPAAFSGWLVRTPSRIKRIVSYRIAYRAKLAIATMSVMPLISTVFNIIRNIVYFSRKKPQKTLSHGVLPSVLRTDFYYPNLTTN